MEDIFQYTLILLGALALIVYSMKVMGEAQQRFFGSWFRSMVTPMRSSVLGSIGGGAFITAVTQSSAATSVMIVSFVNAGLLTLTQSIGVIMGANIGTSVTGWIIAVFGFRFNLDFTILAVLGAGLVLTMFNRERLKAVGNALIGFSLLILAVYILRYTAGNFHDFFTSDGAKAFFYDNRYIFNQTLSSRIPLFFLLGIVLAFLFRSSSVTIVITMLLCFIGVPLECGAAMILGENVGTTFTANIAAAKTNTNARRAALTHTLFNLIGALIALPLLGPLMKLCALLLHPLVGNGTTGPQYATLLLAMFHTMFNLLTTILLVGFIPLLGKLVCRIFRMRKNDAQCKQKRYVNSGMLSTGDMTIFHVQSEVVGYASRVTKMFDLVKALFREHNNESFNDIYTQIENQEAANDETRGELYDFLSKAAKGNIGSNAKSDIEVMFRLVSHIEIMSDYNFSITKLLRTKKDHNIWFAPNLREGINYMFDLVDKALAIMGDNLASTFNKPNPLDDALEMERIINEQRTRLKMECLRTDTHEESTHQAQLIFSDLISRIEQLADTIVHISENAVKLTGSYEK